MKELIISIFLKGMVFIIIAIAWYLFCSWLVMLLWNFITSYFKHPELHITIWVSMALLILLGFLRSVFSK